VTLTPEQLEQIQATIDALDREQLEAFARAILRTSTAPTGGEWLKAGEVAKRLGVHIRTLQQWRRLGRGPRCHLWNGRTRYLAHEVEQWSRSC